MSEVSDATQIVIVTGKSAYLLGNITVKSAAFILKVLNTIYLAKWQGRVSLNRFRRICGGDFLFINMSTEDPQSLRMIEKELTAHGILFSRLPDLCGGDGRTQYVIPPADTAKLKAFLLDHQHGKYGHIKVGPISPEDYARTGVQTNGEMTQELVDLTRSALSELPQKNRDKAGQNLLPLKEVLQVPEVWDAVRKHDSRVEFGKHVSWIKGEPIKTHSTWGLYPMPDGIHAVMIPKQDMIAEKKNKFTGKVVPAEYAVFDSKHYNVIDLQTGDGHLQNGKEIILAMYQKNPPKEPDAQKKNDLQKQKQRSGQKQKKSKAKEMQQHTELASKARKMKGR